MDVCTPSKISERTPKSAGCAACGLAFSNRFFQIPVACRMSSASMRENGRSHNSNSPRLPRNNRPAQNRRAGSCRYISPRRRCTTRVPPGEFKRRQRRARHAAHRHTAFQLFSPRIHQNSGRSPSTAARYGPKIRRSKFSRIKFRVAGDKRSPSK